MNSAYPEKHYDIVTSLTAGVMVHPLHPLYMPIKNHETYYKDFLKATFKAEMKYNKEVYYLSAQRSERGFGRNFLLLLAALVYGLENQDKNAVDALLSYQFSIKEANRYVSVSKHFERYVKGLRFGEGSFSLIKLSNRGIIVILKDDEFRFTQAIEVFLQYYLDISEMSKKLAKIKEEEL